MNIPIQIKKWRTPTKGHSFSITAMIDVVFLLIIFFVIVCHFIRTNAPDVEIPDNCGAAQSEQGFYDSTVIITITKDTDNEFQLIVNTDRIGMADTADMETRLTKAINQRLNATTKNKTIKLRIDKKVPFGIAKYVLAAAGKSSADYILLAVLKEERPDEIEYRTP